MYRELAFRKKEKYSHNKKERFYFTVKKKVDLYPK